MQRSSQPTFKSQEERLLDEVASFRHVLVWYVKSSGAGFETKYEMGRRAHFRGSERLCSNFQRSSQSARRLMHSKPSSSTRLVAIHLVVRATSRSSCGHSKTAWTQNGAG